MIAGSTKRKQTDPVCGMEVDPAAAPAHTCYKGDMIYFCAEECRKAFEAEPRRYSVTQHKGFWRRYLDRLQKATGGKPMSCH